MTAKPQNEPTLAEIVARAKEKTACADNYVCLRQDVADFHARLKALAEGWERIEHAFDGKHGWTVKKKLDPVKLLQEVRAELHAILGDLQP